MQVSSGGPIFVRVDNENYSTSCYVEQSYTSLEDITFSKHDDKFIDKSIDNSQVSY